MRLGFAAVVLSASSAVSAVGMPLQHPMSGDPLMDYRLRSSRAAHAQERLERDVDNLSELSEAVHARISETGVVDNNAARKLEQIRKLARRCRSSMGGSGDARIEDIADDPRQIAAAITERSATIADQLHKSSRFEMNARLVLLAGEIVILSEALIQRKR